MSAILIQTNSESELKLLMQLAKKIGASATKINNEEVETIFLANSIKEGINSGFANTEDVLKKIKNKLS